MTLKIQAMKRKLLVVAGALTLVAGTAVAGPVPVFDEPAIDFSGSNACANYGDFQFCSGQYLNYLVTGSPTGGGGIDYVVQSSQGLLMQALTVITNGNAAVSNTDIGPNIDNAYEIKAGGPQDTVYGTSLLAGEGNNPIIDPSTLVIGEINNAQPVSNQTAMDIGLQALITALTDANGVRHDLLIFFDNNQEGSTQSQNILVAGLVCVQDAQNVLADICYELIDQNGTLNTAENVDPTLFNTAKTYGTPLDPNLADSPFATTNVLANGTFCVDPVSKAVYLFNVANENACGNGPSGQPGVFINNNIGSNVTEFIGGIPELNARMEELLGLGYDLVSVQLLFQNQNDGFEDVFLLAGPATTTTLVPEPGTMLLLSLGVLALGLVSRRRKF